ncbi:S100 calcium binding protein W [Brachyhypopomus gauderio]|uniref:S100 calcium binding protein W n=1 Tax=Brachyhypopomus gauderio TaxID=698409 RepID=UPI0040433FE2
MSKLEKAVVATVEVFEEYAGRDANKQQLSNAELKELIGKELSSPDFKGKVNQEDIQEVMAKIDKNHDGQVNFCEFSQCVALIAKGYYKKKHGKECGMGHGTGAGPGGSKPKH